MKTPVCRQCAKGDAPCAGCKELLAKGKVTKLDFEVSQILCKINERVNISNASFTKAIDLEKTVLILTEGEAGLLIGKQGKIVSELSASLGKKVRIAETKGDVRKTIADLIMPAKLLGINNVYHEGKEITKVRISKHEFAHLPIDIGTLEKALNYLMERETKIVFE